MAEKSEGMAWHTFKKGITTENPTYVQALGMCPTLAVTTAAINGLGMGLAVIVVLTLSNIIVSLIRKAVPKDLRIPIFITVIATFVTMIDLLMHAYTYDLWKSLGIFIPLIVVNCIILGRAEAFASKNPVHYALLDGLGMGVGFTLSLFLLGSIREILGSGTWMGFHLWNFKMFMFILPPGAFITLGFLTAFFNCIKIKREEAKKTRQKQAKTAAAQKA